MARIPLPSPEEMSPEQRRVHDAVVAGPRGVVIGPLRAAIHNPELAERWSKLGEVLRYRTSLPPRLNELAVIVTGRHWTSQIEWYVHARVAAEAGLAAAVIEAIRLGHAPAFGDPDEALIYDFTRQLLREGEVELDLYRRVEARFGARGVVELTALIGYYTMVSLTLNAHEIPLPDGVSAPLRRLDDPQAGPAAQPARSSVGAAE
jgi:4-carboxymuconolactone decarboxylase